jgi:hypothetical protein
MPAPGCRLDDTDPAKVPICVQVVLGKRNDLGDYLPALGEITSLN